MALGLLTPPLVFLTAAVMKPVEAENISFIFLKVVVVVFEGGHISFLKTYLAGQILAKMIGP